MSILVFLLIIPIGFALFNPVEYHKVHPDIKSKNGYGIYKIDTWFWGNDIVDVELMENTDQCLTDCYAILRVYAYQNIKTDSSYQVNFKNTLTDTMSFEDYNVEVLDTITEYYKEEECTDWKYWNKTTDICSEYETVMKNNTYSEWKPIDLTDFEFPIGQDVYIKISGNKRSTQVIDWRLNFYGHRLDEWAWWNANWSRRREINLTVADSMTDQAFRLQLNSSNINYTRTQNDGSDLRFTNSSDDEIDYWIELWNESGQSYVWVELPTFDNVTIYMYYNNSNAVNGTNCTDTFAIYCDDFEDGNVNGWGAGGGASITINDTARNSNWGAIVDANGWKYVYNDGWANQTADFNVEADVFYNSTTDQQYISIARDQTIVNDFNVRHGYDGGALNDDAMCSWDGASCILIEPNNNFPNEEWLKHRWRIEDTGGADDDFDFYTHYNYTHRLVSNESRGTILQEHSVYFVISVATTDLLYIDNVFVYLDYGTPTFDFGAEEDGGGGGASFISGRLNGTTETYYKDSELQPDVWANSSHDYNYSLFLVHNSSGTNYSYIIDNENAGTPYNNNSITIDTTTYSDGEYYLNWSGFNTQADTFENISDGLIFDNTDPNISLFDPSGNYMTTTFPYSLTLNYTITENNTLDYCYWNTSFANGSMVEQDADESCYQETPWAYTSGDGECAIYDDGAINQGGNWDSDSQLWDGVWTLPGYVENAPNYAEMYVNYSVPYGLNNALWRVSTNYTDSNNISIPQSCLNNSDGILQLYINVTDGNGTETNQTFRCFNGSWNKFNDTLKVDTASLSEGGLWEEAIYWNVSAVNISICNLSQVGFNVTSDGTYNLDFFANDSAGNNGTNTTTFSIFYLRANISNVSCGSIYNEIISPTVEANSTENATTELHLVYEDGTKTSLFNFSDFAGDYSNYSIIINLSGYSDGDYNFTYSVTDNNSYTTNVTSCVFSVDTNAPNITFSWEVVTGWFPSLNHTVNFTVTDGVDTNITCNVSYNNESWDQDFENNTLYNLDAILVAGSNIFNASCVDDGNNSVFYNDSIIMNYTQILVRDEETRDPFNISLYNATMFVTLNSSRNITYDNTNSSQMTDWFFFVINDTIRDVRLAIETVYYRAQTDMQNLQNLTIYMFNHSEHYYSQILFRIDTVGYDLPLTVMRPRTTGEDLITSEYPIGSNREVVAYLLDSRLYNVYGYDENGTPIFITALMVSGSRTIDISIPTAGAEFITDRGTYYGHFVSNQFSQNESDNYTLIATGNGGAYTIYIYNWSDSLLTSQSFTGEGSISFIVNKSLYNNSNFYAVFNFSDGVELRRTLSLGSPAFAIPDFGFFNIGSDYKVGMGIFVLLIGLIVVMLFSKIDVSVGLFVGAGIMSLLVWAMELSTAIHTFALIFGIIGGLKLFVGEVWK